MVSHGHKITLEDARGVLRAVESGHAHQQVRKAFNEGKKYLRTCGIEIDYEAKILFYVEQMIDSCMFEKKDIIEWENWNNKTFKEAKTFFEQLVNDDDIYTNVVGGTAKRSRFESAIHTREEQQPEQRDAEAISSNERVQAYFDSFVEAASANEERIQETKCARYLSCPSWR